MQHNTGHNNSISEENNSKSILSKKVNVKPSGINKNTSTVKECALRLNIESTEMSGIQQTKEKSSREQKCGKQPSSSTNIENRAKENLYRQINVYFCIPPMVLFFCLITPVISSLVLCTAAFIGLLTLWVIVGWWTVHYVLPKGRVSPSGKAVFITGCDSGFGHNLSVELDEQGYQVFAACLFPEGKGAELLRTKCSSRLHIIGLDVVKEKQFEDAYEYIKNNLGENVLWAVVANAGIFEFKEFEWFSTEEIRKTFDVNVIGVTNTVKACLPLLRLSRGRIIIVSSYAGRLTTGWHSVYSMSKHALIALGDGLRKELYKFDIGVITIEPYYYRTAILPISNVICEKFDRIEKAEIKETYTDEYARVEAYSQIGFMDSLARDNPQEVVDIMLEAISAKRPQTNYRIDGFFNWVFCIILILVPPVFLDWLDQLAHGRWTFNSNNELVRQRCLYEKIFNEFETPQRTN